MAKSELKSALRTLLVAPSTLCVDAADEPVLDGSGIDLLFVQGRGDRLHGVIVLGDAAPQEQSGSANVNWLWLVVPDGQTDTGAVQEAATALGAGVLRWTGNALERVSPAPPRPGIFISRWPALRARWRTISDW